MAADFTFNSLFHRSCAVIMEDGLVILESDRNSDRMRKILFERVERVILWKRIPWGRIAAITLLIAAPSLSLLLINARNTWIGSATGGGIYALLLLRYLICRKTTLRITSGGEHRNFTFIMRPGLLRKKMANITDAITRIQRSTERSDASDQSDPSDLSDPSDPSDLSDLSDNHKAHP